MHTEESVNKFRKNYRAQISAHYNGFLHMGIVASVGVSFIAYQFSKLDSFRWPHAFGIFAGLIAWNFMEYFGHRRLGHKKRRVAAMFYKRHTGDHHSFFSETLLVPQNHKDWRVTLFPAWLVVVISALATVEGEIISLVFGFEWGAVGAATLMIGYLSYEFFHFCDHLPQNHFLVKLPWIGHMRHLHKLHHRRDLMHSYNFSVTFPLADFIFGTFYWIPPDECEQER